MFSRFIGVNKKAFRYRALIFIALAAFLTELGYAVMNFSALPMYVTYTLKQGPALGLIISSFLLAEALSRPVFGALGDRIGRKPLLILGPVITAFTAYLTIKLQNPVYLIGLRALDGIGAGAFWPSAFAAVGDLVEDKNRSTAMSIINMTYMSGIALGFLLGGVANEMFNTYLASFYVVSVLLAVGAIISIIFLPAKLGKGHHVDIDMPGYEPPQNFKLHKILRSVKEAPDMMVLALVTFLGIGILMPVVKLYSVQYLGLSETQFGLAVAPVAAAMGIFAVPLGRFGDRVGKACAVCWGLLICAIAMWVIPQTRNIVIVGSAGAVLGLGFTVAFPAWMALVSMSVKPERRGEILGAVGMAQGLAAIVGASLGAFIYSSDLFSFPRLGVVNYAVPFWFSAILLSIATVIAFTWVWKMHGHKDPCQAVKEWHRKLVVFAAIIGVFAIGTWISYRYARPVSPERVAWSWVQQAIRNRPDKAFEYACTRFDKAADGEELTREVAKTYSAWKEEHDVVYTVRPPKDVTKTHAVVPVWFRFPGGKLKIEHIVLVKTQGGEWKVCGVYEER